MNFLIVIPRFINALGEPYHFPTGLAYISTSLKQAGFQVECLNLNHYNEPLDELLSAYITSKNIDVVCTGGLSAHYSRVKEILEAACRVKPNVITIAGGGLISSEPALMLRGLGLNYGVIGEGEITIVKLAEALSNQRDPQEVNGIIYVNDDNEVSLTPSRKEIIDLDTLPCPDYAGLEMEKYLASHMPADQYFGYPFDHPREVPIIASRSCPYGCTFCYHPLGNKYRQRSLDGLFQEVDFLVRNYQVNILVILDELFAIHRGRVEEFCHRIREYDLKWLVSLRVDGVDKALLAMMKEAGCYYVSYGVESASETVLKSMKKRITLPQIEKALQETREVGLGIQANLIFGDPAETKETVEESLNWWARHPQYQINLGLIQVYPGAKLYHGAIERGLITDRLKFIADGCPLINLTRLTDEEYLELCRRVYELPGKYLYLPSNYIYCEKTGTVTHKGDVFYLKIKCPHCQAFVEYHNMSRLPGFSRLGCKECNQRFWVPREIFGQAAAKYQANLEGIQEFVRRGQAAVQAGRLENAQAIFTDLIAKFPTYLNGHFALAQVALAQGNLALAEKSFRRCLCLDPTNLNACMNLAEMARIQKYYNEAAGYYNQALKEHPDNVELLVAIGRLALEIGEPEGAQMAFQRALNLDPSCEVAGEGLELLRKV